MHELSLAQSLVEQLKQTVRDEEATCVERLTVVMGPYSGVERDAFEFAFPFAAEDSPAEQAELIIEELPATVECANCSASSHPDPRHLQCTSCGSDNVKLIGGREFYIRSIELQLP